MPVVGELKPKRECSMKILITKTILFALVSLAVSAPAMAQPAEVVIASNRGTETFDANGVPIGGNVQPVSTPLSFWHRAERDIRIERVEVLLNAVPHVNTGTYGDARLSVEWSGTDVWPNGNPSGPSGVPVAEQSTPDGGWHPGWDWYSFTLDEPVDVPAGVIYHVVVRQYPKTKSGKTYWYHTAGSNDPIASGDDEFGDYVSTWAAECHRYEKSSGLMVPHRHRNSASVIGLVDLAP